jgi:hypothetical protein
MTVSGLWRGPTQITQLVAVQGGHASDLVADQAVHALPIPPAVERSSGPVLAPALLSGWRARTEVSFPVRNVVDVAEGY